MGDGLATTDLVPPVIATPELEAGAWLGERYRLIARLGRGGGGAVWRVFDEKVGEELALKLLEGGTELERWRREVALARRISHGNVCRVYDLGEARGLRWVTMEWIEGESLRTLLQRGAIAEPERLIRQLVDGVAAIHAAGVVHRDLKPENVVVDAGGRAVIVDFGLARGPLAVEPAGSGGHAAPSGGATSHGAVLGTPRYMAPEQAAGEVVDARSDVYALGLVLEEVLAGAAAARARGSNAGAKGSGLGTTSSGAPGGGPDAPVHEGAAGSATRGSPTAVASTVDAIPGSPRAAQVPPRASAGWPRPWGPVIARCTAHAAADRFPDAVALRAALAPRRTQRTLIVASVLVAVAAVAALALVTGGDPAAGAPIAQRRLTATADAPATQPTSIAVSPDGRMLAHTVGVAVMIRTIDGGRDTGATMPTTFGGMPLARLVEAIGFLADGRVVAQILDRDHAWALWALGAGKVPQTLYRHGERMIAAVSPRGDQLAVTTPAAGLFVAPLAGGPDRTLVGARAGERLAGLAWSPDGARVAFVRHGEDGSATLEVVAVARPVPTAVLARLPAAHAVDPRAQATAWPSSDRVVYVANPPEGAALIAVPVAGTAPPVALLRWSDEHVAQIAWGGARMVVLRGNADRALRVGTVDRRGYFLNLVRHGPEHMRAGQLAGWTTDGRLVHGTEGNVVASVPFGATTVLAAGSPEAIAGDAVVYRRDAAVRTVAVAGGGDRALAEAAVAGGAMVRCAGDRTPPCVLAEVDDASVRYLRFDPATGARGEELYRARRGQLTRSMAVSPDGATLAVADGSSAVTLVRLGPPGSRGRDPLVPPRAPGPAGAPGASDPAAVPGDRRIELESLARSAEVVEVSWSHDGASLLVSVLGGGDDRASVIRLRRGGPPQFLLRSDQVVYDRVREAPGGAYVAIQTREVTLDAWLIEGM